MLVSQCFLHYFCNAIKVVIAIIRKADMRCVICTINRHRIMRAFTRLITTIYTIPVAGSSYEYVEYLNLQAVRL